MLNLPTEGHHFESGKIEIYCTMSECECKASFGVQTMPCPMVLQAITGLS